ncbi:MAG: ABC transporter ATP-binding protein [Acidimicrobiia bacterium]|nr:ABC transporter ATP-binding protein [Actinomycetota bacterium]NDH47236.1 ABC transporter ATP-binding protein [Acidimicrobiia bacterium]
MSSEPILSVQNLSKTYRVFGRPHERVFQAIADRRGSGRLHCFEVPAVKDVSFVLNAGESISIIGRNGSGKSTLLEMIVGTLQPTTGSVTRPERISALLELGAGFNPDFTGRENFRMAASIHGLHQSEIDAIEEKVERFAEIGRFIDEPVRTYSSGMYVRLAFASAVHVKPDLLIVDEALAVGDIFFQQKCFEFLDSNLRDTPKLIVTHDLASAVRLSTRCIVLENGHVVFDGEPLEAVEIYTAASLRANSQRRIEEAELLESAESITEGESGNEANPEFNTTPPAASGVGLSSARELLEIREIAVVVNGKTTIAETGIPVVVTHGDDVKVDFLASVGTTVSDPVWGYTMRDRMSTPVFGENTIGCGISVDRMEPGMYRMSMGFLWPEVQQGEYTMTIGVGDGRHSLHHEIVAWVQSVLQFAVVPKRDVHGLFNNDLTSFSFRPK